MEFNNELQNWQIFFLVIAVILIPYTSLLGQTNRKIEEEKKLIKIQATFQLADREQQIWTNFLVNESINSILCERDLQKD